MPNLRLSTKETVPVGKILCLARNYAAHASEMGGTPPEHPVFFLKPDTTYVPDGGTVHVPEVVQLLHHEVELAVVVARTARSIPETRWKDFVLGYGVALDMTARDLQDEARRRGEPWTLSKSFDTFCPISTIVERGKIDDPQKLDLELWVNGELKQRGNTKDMIFGIPKLLAYLSDVMTLERGDVILTGTPEGVGLVKRGDKLEARVPGLVKLTVKVDERPKRR